MLLPFCVLLKEQTFFKTFSPKDDSFSFIYLHHKSGYKLSASEKWANLYGEHVRAAGNIKVVDHSKKIKSQCSMSTCTILTNT